MAQKDVFGYNLVTKLFYKKGKKILSRRGENLGGDRIFSQKKIKDHNGAYYSSDNTASFSVRTK